MGEGGAAYSSAELLRVFWPFFSPYRWRIAGAALALLMVAGALLTMGRGLAYLVDEGLGRQDPELLNGAVIGTAVIAFVLASALCFVFMMSGVEIIQSFFRAWTPQAFVESVAELSFLTHFNDVSQGVIDIRDVVFFLSVIGVALFANAAIVEAKKGV